MPCIYLLHFCTQSAIYTRHTFLIFQPHLLADVCVVPEMHGHFGNHKATE